MNYDHFKIKLFVLIYFYFFYCHVKIIKIFKKIENKKNIILELLV